MFDDVDNLTFGDAADLIELKAALALKIFGRFSGTKEGVGDHGDCNDSRSAHAQCHFQIGE
jgi:hypothetical protein